MASRGLGGKDRKRLVNASKPPADAPTPTIANDPSSEDGTAKSSFVEGVGDAPFRACGSDRLVNGRFGAAPVFVFLAMSVTVHAFRLRVGRETAIRLALFSPARRGTSRKVGTLAAIMSGVSVDPLPAPSNTARIRCACSC